MRLSKPQEGRRASIEAITSGAVIFGAAVGYITVRNQLALLGQVAAVSVIGFFIILWLGVFGTPVVRSFWSVVRQRMRTDASLTARIEALERKHNELLMSWGQEAQNVLAMLSLLELSTSTNTVFLLSDRATTEEMTEKLRGLTDYAGGIARTITSLPNRTGLEKALKSTLGILIVTAAMKHIPFETTASILANGLGLRYAGRLVDVSSIIDGYGLDYASKWRNLVRAAEPS